LKNLDEPVRVIRVLPDGVDHARALAPYVAKPTRGRLRASPKALVAIGVALAVATTAVLVPIIRDSGGVSMLLPNAVGLIDLKTGQKIGSVSVGSGPGAIASGLGFVWVANSQSNTVSKIDQTTRMVVDTIQVGQDPSGIAIGNGAVWVSAAGDGKLDRIDPTSGRVVGIPVGNGPAGVVVSDGSVWVANFLDDSVSSVNAQTDVVSKPIQVGDGPTAVVAYAGSIWGRTRVRRPSPGSTPRPISR
jgi:YVTN family beta-propeller protein